MTRAAAVLIVLVSILGSARAEPAAPPVAIADLVRQMTPVTVTTEDPVYKRSKSYVGYPLAAVLRAAWPDVDRWAEEGAELVLTAVDGYAPSMDLARALNHNGIVAFREADRPENDPWEPFAKGRSMLTPDPYYLVWTGIAADDPHFRWPYKLATVSVTSFDARYGGAAPPARANPQVQRGFRVFVQNCMPCHSVNLIGGNTGPELNVPKNITEYWSTRHIAAFIAAPESYRLRSKMPSFATLPEADRTAAVAYLSAMKTRKSCGEGKPC
ncbi:cbb3-type cytochrome c oxidase subunit III [Stella humosa]|uniref:Cbb3-type cytochrome c oxidase subunit III n=2 Tax=Stella humosa TaxID=94 RepID=A0A3N1LI28_9PROT|nr:cbb3-type cytochrome c oxidase subunit III [Stella humosa]BBK34777.1 cytochrome c [Stella humosa]